MAHDADDPQHVNIYKLGDLTDVADTTPVDKGTLVYSAADSEYKRVAPAAAIANATDATTAISQLNLLLAAARTHGIVT